MHTKTPAIEVQHLRKSYKKVKVLQDVLFSVEPGSVFALLGANGAGKTTTINILTTLIAADEGTATIDGYDVARKGNTVRKRISLTGQFAAVDDILTGRENLSLICELRHIKRAKETAARLLEQFDLTEAADRRVGTYSGGMRRRLDIAMSLIGNPSVVFLDEPTTGLDPQSRTMMWETIKTLAGTGTTVFLTTQYLEEADQLADTIAVLDRGNVVARGTPEQLKRLLPQGKIEFKFDTSKQLALAAQALQHYETSQDKRALSLTVITEGSVANIAEIFRRLETVHVVVSEFSKKTPTLDEAFLKIINDHREGYYAHAA